MANQFGRISGPLLQNNLVRNGVDLAFENSLLYLNTGSKYLGVNTNTPVADLNVGTISDTGGTAYGILNTLNLIGTGTSTLANFSISTNTIAAIINGVTIQPDQGSDPTIVTTGVSTDNLLVNSGGVTAVTSNTDVNLNPSGTGQVVINNSVLVRGDLHATGDITFDGDIQFGDQPTDTITILAEVSSDIIPDLTNQWTLGDPTHYWNNVYANTLTSTNALSSTSTLTVGEIDLNNFTAGNVSAVNNTISNAISTNDVTLSTSGTGSVNFTNSGISIRTNTFTTAPGPLTLSSTGTGYWKFAGDKALVVGAGTTPQRPSSPELGTFRWNTDNQASEVYSGSTNGWVGVLGTSPILSLSAVYDVAEQWALILA